ncbi:MAG: phosphoribosyltransferase, partial [Planctomycetota bacterium]
MNPETTPILADPMHADLDKILIDRERIAGRVAELAREISHDLHDVTDRDELVIVSVLTGSIIFLADLIRQLPQKLRIEVIGVESYPGRATESRGPKITRTLSGNIEGRHVLIVDDILDSGGTMGLIRKELAKRGPKSVRACVLLRK